MSSASQKAPSGTARPGGSDCRTGGFRRRAPALVSVAIVAALMVVLAAPASALNYVSCPTASFCAAVSGGEAWTYNGHSWSAPVRIASEAASSVSCPSASFCAVGDEYGHVLTYNGSSWSAPTKIIPNPVLHMSVSCTSASFCVAVTSADSVATYNGSSWSAPVSLVGTSELWSVSCASSSFCVAAGLGENAFTYNGSSWSAPMPLGAGAGGIYFGMSCPSASFCAAVATTGTHVGGGNTAVTYNGSSWSAPTPISPGEGLYSVSCPSASFCWAVGEAGDAVSYNGSSWSAPVKIDGTIYGAFGPTSIRSVSCPSASFCVASDLADNVLTYDGSSWSAPVRLPIEAMSPVPPTIVPPAQPTPGSGGPPRFASTLRILSLAGASRNGSLTVSLSVTGYGRIDVLERAKTPAPAHKKPHLIVVGHTAATATHAGTIKLTVKLNNAGRKLLRTRHKLPVSVSITYTPTGHTSIVTTTHVTLRLKH
jgi:hypothetical protein